MGYKNFAAAVAVAVTAIVDDSSFYEKDVRSASGAAPKRKLLKFIIKFPNASLAVLFDIHILPLLYK